MQLGLGGRRRSSWLAHWRSRWLHRSRSGATGLDNNLDQRLLAGHNRERAALGIPALAWGREAGA